MRIVFTLISVAVWSVSAACAAPIIGSYDYSPIGAPAGTGKMTIEVTIVVNGNPVTKTVTIPSGDIKPYPASGICAPADTDAQCAQKIADARGAASQAKATVMANAINTTFAAEFKALGQTVTTGNIVVSKTITARGTKFPNTMATYGALVIPGVAENQGKPLVFTENGVLGEGGNGGKFIKPAGPSPSVPMKMRHRGPGI